MTRRHYRYRPRIYARTPGCVGCSVPMLLLVLAALAWVVVR